MRLRPRSIRVRDTMISAVLAVLVLGLLALAADLGLRNAIRGHELAEVQLAARRISAAVREDAIGATIAPDPGGVRFLQVVRPDGQVLAASKDAAGMRPLSTARPPREARVQDVRECPGPTGGCLLVEAIRVTTAADSPVVYAAQPMPSVLGSGLLELGLAAPTILLAALVALLTWRIVGRTLRPVAQIRSELAEITVTDLSRRVPEPSGRDELAELARTVNETLDRLQESVARQRQFASDASHELRTPIAGLRANLEDAAMHPGDVDQEAVIGAALRDIDRLESIVKDLLLLARIGTGGPAREPVGLTELVRGEVARRTTKVPVRTALEPGLPVRGVRMQLVRLLDNLMDNAERYADRTIYVETRRDGGEAVLVVADDGVGIAEADRERVFERFTRLDTARSRDAGGTGLGLAIARDIATAHGGSLRVTGGPPGARFELRLPLA